MCSSAFPSVYPSRRRMILYASGMVTLASTTLGVSASASRILSMNFSHLIFIQSHAFRMSSPFEYTPNDTVSTAKSNELDLKIRCADKSRQLRSESASAAEVAAAAPPSGSESAFHASSCFILSGVHPYAHVAHTLYALSCSAVLICISIEMCNSSPSV